MEKLRGHLDTIRDRVPFPSSLGFQTNSMFSYHFQRATAGRQATNSGFSHSIPEPAHWRVVLRQRQAQCLAPQIETTVLVIMGKTSSI